MLFVKILVAFLLPVTLTRQYDRTICGGQTTTISCGSRIIHVKRVFYGRDTPNTCPWRRVFSFCSDGRTAQQVRTSCESRRFCQVSVFRSIALSNPCRNASPYLQIMYECKYDMVLKQSSTVRTTATTTKELPATTLTTHDTVRNNSVVGTTELPDVYTLNTATQQNNSFAHVSDGNSLSLKSIFVITTLAVAVFILVAVAIAIKVLTTITLQHKATKATDDDHYWTTADLKIHVLNVNSPLYA